MDVLNKSLGWALQSRAGHLLGLLFLSLAIGPICGQQLPELVKIPPTATALEGVPSVLISSGESGTEKKMLNAGEATKNRLLVTIVNGRFYWASRGNRPLELQESGVFIHLYEGPGAYVKFTRIGNKIVYMEHANIFLSTLTYWGELKIITGR